MVSKHKLLLLLVISLVFVSTHAHSQIVLGVNTYPSVYFGYRDGDVVVFTGLDFQYLSYVTEATDVKADTTVFKWDDSWFSITPYVGLKLFLAKKQLSPFLRISAGKEIPLTVSAKGTRDNEVEEEVLRDLHDDYFFNASLGGEFELSENIGISAEYGTLFYFQSYDRDENESTTHTEQVVVRSLAIIGFHYYF